MHRCDFPRIAHWSLLIAIEDHHLNYRTWIRRRQYIYENADDGYEEDLRCIPRASDQLYTRKIRFSDARTAMFFLFLVNYAFFGTGNLASISHFSLESVYRLWTLFDPFLMGVLLILKILIPFFMLSSAFGVLARVVHLPPFSLFIVSLAAVDVATLNFFFLVRDDGSWLEIGTSISHYIINSSFIVFSILLFTISHVLVGNVLVPGPPERRKHKE